ncbi:MAG: DUF3240 family protein [Hyphomicrobiaceae bacterium]
MDHALCKLTLVFSPSGADRIIDLLLTTEPPLQGFTSWTGEGHGHSFGAATISERVRGRVQKSGIFAVLEPSRATDLLEEIRIKSPVIPITFWIEPVTRFGHLTTDQ